jgi:DNA-binding transcriptional ArsR family regulator
LLINGMSSLRATPLALAAEDPETALLDRVFFALSDPVRRQVLERLDGQALLVSELAAPFAISLQAVSRHIQVLVRAGLVRQERTGRISRCSLDAGPVYAAAVWLNRYAKYWQAQFDLLAATLTDIEERRGEKPRAAGPRGRRKQGAPRRR